MQSIWQDVRGIIWAPIEFARQQTEGEEHWMRPISIVVLTGSFHVVLFLSMQARLTEPIKHYLLQLQVAEDLARSFDDFSAIVSFLSIAGGISIIPFWVVGAGVMTCWAVLFNGRENFRKVLIISGYAHLPLLVFAAVAIGIISAYPPSAEMPITTSTDIAQIVGDVQNYRDELLRAPPVRLVRILGYGAQLWFLALLAVAASVSQRMSYIKGAFAASFYGAMILMIRWIFE
jgi:hypothetical protein